MKAARALALAALTALAGQVAEAGRSCAALPPAAASVRLAMDLAEHTAAQLEASGAQVVVIARIGQDLSRHGLRYSHFGLAYRDAEAGPAVWRIVHKLNACGTATAQVYRQGLAEFFLDDLHEYEAALVLPSEPLQQHLLPVLRDNARLARLHEPAYNMLAYPWSQRYQQSNQWAIETLAMAQEPAASTRERAQAWLELRGYEPTTLHLSALTRLGARISAANIAFDDHPDEKRYSDRIETVTVDSVFAWLARSGLGAAPLIVR